MGLTASGLQLFQDGLLPRVPARLRPAFVFGVQRLIALADRHEPADRRDQNALVFALVAEKPRRGAGARGVDSPADLSA
jgi:hypothetical protein